MLTDWRAADTTSFSLLGGANRSKWPPLIFDRGTA
jgi:hypothetical protein